MVQVLIHSNSKVNAMTLAYIAKLGLITCKKQTLVSKKLIVYL